MFLGGAFLDCASRLVAHLVERSYAQAKRTVCCLHWTKCDIKELLGEYVATDYFEKVFNSFLPEERTKMVHEAGLETSWQVNPINPSSNYSRSGCWG
jgi:hypothetical protein